MAIFFKLHFGCLREVHASQRRGAVWGGMEGMKIGAGELTKMKYAYTNAILFCNINEN